MKTNYVLVDYDALFQKNLSEEELASLLYELQKQGIVVVNDTKVSYALPT